MDPFPLPDSLFVTLSQFGRTAAKQAIVNKEWSSP
jgi:hypothetical protein